MSAIELFVEEAEVALSEDFTLRLTINLGAIARIEGLLNKGMDEIIGEMNTKTSVITKVLWGFTREHHSDLTLDQIAFIQFKHENRHAVMATLGGLVNHTFNLGEPDAEGEQSRPPRKRSAGASRASSGSGARQGSGHATSGGKRRAAL